MKIPKDLTPFEFITGTSSRQRKSVKYYIIPNKIYERIIDEIEKLWKTKKKIKNI